MMGTLQLSGIILTAGLDKSDPLHPRLLEGLIQALSPLVDECIVVAGNLPDFLDLDALLVGDPDEAPTLLSALHAGLSHAGSSHALVLSWQQPLVQPRLLQTLLGRVESRWDLIAPAPAGRPVPFPAVYAGNYLKRIEHMLSKGEHTFEPLFKRVRMKVVSEKVLRQNDPRLISFLNITQPDEEVKIRARMDSET